MPGISAPRTGHRAGRSGSLRRSLLALVLVPGLGLAAAWGYALYLLRDAGHRIALSAVSAAVAVLLVWSLVRGVRLARAVSARLLGLRADALAVAQHEIPQVVGRLRTGEAVPPPPSWSPSRRVGDELQQAAEGVAAVRTAALTAIVHQAHGREGTKKVFLNIARRTQILLHRQISMLDALEREHEDPELLRELFAVDHLATRMRRNAENLVILGGALPARRWRNAVPVVNVLRSAVSETENYSRVVVRGIPRVSLGGEAVADVIHLVAELIENGTTFSPPYTKVQVSAQEVSRGLAVEVEDRGLGMSPEEYERLNAYLADPPELDVSALGDDLRLGLFVVARLATRHRIQVTLRSSPYGGTRAVVLVPSVLLEQAELPPSVAGLPSGARVTRTPVEAAPERDGGAGADLRGGTGGSGGRDGTGARDGGGGGGRGGTSEELSDALAGVLGGLLGAGPAGVGPGPSAPASPTTGSPIPGLPDAVVVTRPALPGRHHGPADEPPTGAADGGLPGGEGPAMDGAAVGGPVADGFGSSAGAPAPPAQGRIQEVRSEHGPDGLPQTPPVLPRRVRNAGLAEQLRQAHAPAAVPPPGPPAGGGASAVDDTAPERSRATMAAVQRGTRAARAADPSPEPPAAPPAASTPPTSPAAPPAAPPAAEEQP
ncbi:sensor histidine kinase [Kitasatospora sp. NPDC091207]|uniref:sensor histidine kinase n=1 Tax=Kitasatospora sp. NPDC091207 TaxID=3364083 RepID=UPI0038275A29